MRRNPLIRFFAACVRLSVAWCALFWRCRRLSWLSALLLGICLAASGVLTFSLLDAQRADTMDQVASDGVSRGADISWPELIGGPYPDSAHSEAWAKAFSIARWRRVGCFLAILAFAIVITRWCHRPWLHLILCVPLAGVAIYGMWVYPMVSAYWREAPAEPQQAELVETRTIPAPEYIGGPHPKPTYPEPRGQIYRLIDIGVFVAVLTLATVTIHWSRRRWILLILMSFSLLYFGFYRSGCICPVGSIQNVALSLAEPAYTISIVVTLVFLLPMVLSLFVGRVFCGGVCPFGAVQDLLLRFKFHVPWSIDKPLRYLRWVYLGAAVFFAIGGVQVLGLDLTVQRDFIICRYDPFVGLFRLVNFRAIESGQFARAFEVTGPTLMWSVTGVLLVGSVFIGRPYCRWLCPYGAVLGLCARAAKRGVTVMPDQCCDCRLCEKACVMGAIEDHAAVSATCLACARCYKSCPLERQRRGDLLPEVAHPLPIEPPPVPAVPQRAPVAARRVVGEHETIDLAYLPELVERFGRGQAAALPLLQAIQGRHRYLPRPALEGLADLTELSMGQLLGICTFYNQFRLTPIGEHLVAMCHGTACHVAGARRITDAMRLHLGIASDADTDAARLFTIQEIACLGCCSLAPVMQIDGVTFGHLTSETACRALDSARAGQVHAPAGQDMNQGPAVCACGPEAIDREAPQ